jgi:hypothetical protein
MAGFWNVLLLRNHIGKRIAAQSKAKLSPLVHRLFTADWRGIMSKIRMTIKNEVLPIHIASVS